MEDNRVIQILWKIEENYIEKGEGEGNDLHFMMMMM